MTRSTAGSKRVSSSGTSIAIRPATGRGRRLYTKLDAFKAIIDTRLKSLPELSAVRLLEEIRAAGYAGGYTQLKQYVRTIRPR